MRNDRDIIYGQKLQKLRTYHNYTQKMCVFGLKLKRQQQISGLEKGDMHFTQQILLRICDFFKVSYSDFVNPHNLDSFPNLESNTGEKKSMPLSLMEDLQFQILLLKRKVMENELTIIKLKEQLMRGGNSMFGEIRPANRHSVYVML